MQMQAVHGHQTCIAASLHDVNMNWLFLWSCPVLLDQQRTWHLELKLCQTHAMFLSSTCNLSTTKSLLYKIIFQNCDCSYWTEIIPIWFTHRIASISSSFSASRFSASWRKLPNSADKRWALCSSALRPCNQQNIILLPTSEYHIAWR